MKPIHRSPAEAITAATRRAGDAKRYITENPYWRTSGSADGTDVAVASGVLRQLRDLAEKLTGLRVVRASAEEETAFRSYPTDRTVSEARNAKLVSLLGAFLSDFGLSASDRKIEELIHEYDRIFRAWPARDLQGGFGYNNGLYLFAFVRIVDPEVLLESGCWRGFTTYLMDAASSPSTQLYCFDINLRQLQFVSQKAIYYEEDAADQEQLEFRGRRALAFFDDHVSHLERLRLADALGVSFMAFDDDVTALNVHSDGWPPIPTISMLFDAQAITRLEWVSNHRRLVADWSAADRAFMAGKRYVHQTPADLFEITGYRNSSRTTYVASDPSFGL